MGDLVELPRAWRIVMEGDTAAYMTCWRAKSAREYLFDRLYSGQSVNVEQLGSWGFRFVQIAAADP